MQGVTVFVMEPLTHSVRRAFVRCIGDGRPTVEEE
jgi:hypothetical protein